MLKILKKTERMRLIRFVCSFAWADLEVRPEERRFIDRIMRRLELDASERREVEEWIRVPPDPESVDPTEIPQEHRKLFLQVVEELLTSDHELHREELDHLYLFRQLLS